jgi:UPF0176 protein
MENTEHVVLLFYKFIDLDDPKAFADAHRARTLELGMKGRLIVAEEGINGTFEGTREAVEAYKEFIHADPRFADMLIKESRGTGEAFSRLSVRVRSEVVTLGAGRFDVAAETATELPSAELQKWYENGEDFVVLDLRNDYEIASGKFDKTIDPGLANFRDLPEKLSEMGDLKGKKVVTVCTGGIRCEKATCLLKREGFSDVYQLKDGIHTYMQQYPNEHFKGSLFVFDNRMVTSVVDGIETEVIGTCMFCQKSTENYCSDDSTRPSRKVLCCIDCYETRKDSLRSTAPGV